MKEETIRAIMNTVAVHSVCHRGFLIALISGKPVIEELVWQCVEPQLTNAASPAFRRDVRANIQDILTAAEMLKGG